MASRLQGRLSGVRPASEGPCRVRPSPESHGDTLGPPEPPRWAEIKKQRSGRNGFGRRDRLGVSRTVWVRGRTSNLCAEVRLLPGPLGVHAGSHRIGRVGLPRRTRGAPADRREVPDPPYSRGRRSPHPPSTDYSRRGLDEGSRFLRSRTARVRCGERSPRPPRRSSLDRARGRRRGVPGRVRTQGQFSSARSSVVHPAEGHARSPHEAYRANP